MTDCEDPPALLGVDPGQVEGRVLLTGLLVAKNESGLNFVLKEKVFFFLVFGLSQLTNLGAIQIIRDNLGGRGGGVAKKRESIITVA